MTNLLPAAADGPDMSESTTVMVGANVGPLLTRAEDKSSGGRSLAAMLGLCQALPVHLVRRDGVVTITLAPPGSEAPEGAVEAILVARQASTDLVDFLAGGGAPRARGSRDRRGSR